MAKEIKLTHGKVTIVDDEDLDQLIKHKWNARWNGHWYASRNFRAGLKWGSLQMHRVITNAPTGMHVDHINGNTLDNRKANLRICLPAENKRNRKLSKTNKAGYKGVSAWRGRWRSQIQLDHKVIYIGVFSTPEEAARAYDNKARELFGEFARTNF